MKTQRCDIPQLSWNLWGGLYVIQLKNSKKNIAWKLFHETIFGSQHHNNIHLEDFKSLQLAAMRSSVIASKQTRISFKDILSLNVWCRLTKATYLKFWKATGASRMSEYTVCGKIVTDKHKALEQRSGTYGSQDRCGSFDDSIWLA